MKINKLLTSLILEQKIFKDWYSKLVEPKSEPGKPPKKGLIDFETLKALVFADPKARVPQGKEIKDLTVQDMENVRVSGYGQWILKRFLLPKESDLGFEGDVDKTSKEYKSSVAEYRRLFMEDLYKVTRDLQEYLKIQQYLPLEDRNIEKFTPKTLFNLIDNFQLPEKKRKELERKEAKKTRDGFKHAGGKIIFEGPNWTVVEISDQGTMGKDAAIYYGGNQEIKKDETNWCTSAPGLNYFEGYIKKGPLYVILPNDDKGEVGKLTGLPKERYQFHFESDQFMDRKDHRVELVSLLNGPMKELKHLFKDKFLKGLTIDSDEQSRLTIDYPKKMVGMFAALYGLEEVFDAIPENIDTLTIRNSSSENISIDIPKSITRLKNLTALNLDNIAKSLPENLGDLKKLNLMCFINNKDLKTLPESVINIPNLFYITLTNSNNIVFPPKLKERLIDQGDGFYFVKKN